MIFELLDLRLYSLTLVLVENYKASTAIRNENPAQSYLKRIQNTSSCDVSFWRTNLITYPPSGSRSKSSSKYCVSIPILKHILSKYILSLHCTGYQLTIMNKSFNSGPRCSAKRIEPNNALPRQALLSCFTHPRVFVFTFSAKAFASPFSFCTNDDWRHEMSRRYEWCG